jgi:hypothetical protein
MSGENTHREYMERFDTAEELLARVKREERERQAQARRLARLADPGGRLVR